MPIKNDILKNLFDYGFRLAFSAPSLLLRQFSSVIYLKYLTKWSCFGKWLARYSIKSIPVSAGSIGMGCIGFPNHPVWEVTSRCNLNCIHCHTKGGNRSDEELTTEEGKKLIDELARVRKFRILVYTGGEPLMRDDIFELLEYSRKAGFINIVATNGTLIDDNIALNLKKCGVAGIAVSLDSCCSLVHNKIRKNFRAFEDALRGIEAVKKSGMLLQVNTTAMEMNFEDLDRLVDFIDELGSGLLLLYQLVPVGRGKDIRDSALNADYNKKLLDFMARKQKDSVALIEPVASPQYWAYLLEKSGKNSGIWLKLAQKVFHGCVAGNGLVYIKANGEVWPCPFVEVNAGNIKEKSFLDIWENSDVFKNLRNKKLALNGRCGKCRYIDICGGCRGRSMAYRGNYLDDDFLCFLNNN
ncbi:MAG: radical SAM protein [Actinobacteria bacterium]|nr:radical SAM protein [Actinomycetota bacterium]